MDQYWQWSKKYLFELKHYDLALYRFMDVLLYFTKLIGIYILYLSPDIYEYCGLTLCVLLWLKCIFLKWIIILMKNYQEIFHFYFHMIFKMSFFNGFFCKIFKLYTLMLIKYLSTFIKKLLRKLIFMKAIYFLRNSMKA